MAMRMSQRPTCPTTLLRPWSMFSFPFEGASFKEGSAWESTDQIVIRTWLVVEHENECGEYPGMLRGLLSVP